MKIRKLLAIALLPTLWSYTQAQEQTTEASVEETAEVVSFFFQAEDGIRDKQV